jgi:hypothetical protein
VPKREKMLFTKIDSKGGENIKGRKLGEMIKEGVQLKF